MGSLCIDEVARKLDDFDKHTFYWDWQNGYEHESCDIWTLFWEEDWLKIISNSPALPPIVNQMEDETEQYGGVEGNIFDENVKTVVTARDENRHQNQRKEYIREPVGENERNADQREKYETAGDFYTKGNDQKGGEENNTVVEIDPFSVLMHFCGK